MITPGEWQVSAGELLRVVIKGTGIAICGVHRIGRYKGGNLDEQTMANARLIAAAPRMRAALAECASHLDGALGASQRPDSDSGELWTEIKALLAEVDGHV